jgi:hypothetical protein
VGEPQRENAVVAKNELEEGNRLMRHSGDAGGALEKVFEAGGDVLYRFHYPGRKVREGGNLVSCIPR